VIEQPAFFGRSHNRRAKALSNAYTLRVPKISVFVFFRLFFPTLIFLSTVLFSHAMIDIY
jgi:hypothetical protein